MPGRIEGHDAGDVGANSACMTQPEEKVEQASSDTMETRITTFTAGPWSGTDGAFKRLAELCEDNPGDRGEYHMDLVQALLDHDEVTLAADVLGRALSMITPSRRRAFVDVALATMKALVGSREAKGVISVYRQLRENGFIGPVRIAAANKTVMATCYAAQAAEMTGAHKDATEIYEEFKRDKEDAGGGPGWGGLSQSLPGVLFRTHFKAKRFESAIPYIDEAITSKRYSTPILCNMAISCLGKAGRWTEALEVYRRMEGELGHRPNSMTYGVLINALGTNGQCEQSMAIMDAMIGALDLKVPNNVPGATVALNSALKSCSIAGRWEQALGLMRRAEEVGIRPDSISFHTVINVLARAGRCDRALDVLKAMMELKLKPNLSACHFLLTNCSKHKQGKAAFELLSIMRKAHIPRTSLSYNAVMTALYREGDHAKVANLFHEMRTYRKRPDSHVVQLTLRCFEQLEQHDEAMDVIRYLWSLDMPVDATQYSRAFSVLANGGRTQVIRDFLRDMEARGEAPEEPCYTSLILSICREENWAEADRLLVELRDQGKPVRTAAYTTVISFCKENGEWRRALELFDEMASAPEDRGLAPNDYTYNAIISVLAHNGCLDVAAEKFKEMRQAGFPYDHITYVNMILGFAKQGLYTDVLVFFRGLEALSSTAKSAKFWAKKQTVNWTCHNEAMRACEVVGDWRMAGRLLASMRREGLAPDVVMCGAAISACARAGKWREALTILRDMKEIDGIEPNVVCYSSAITACHKGREWRKALHLLLKMINSGVPPDTIAYNACISASAKCGEWAVALQLMDSLLRAGLKPTERTFSAAIMACSKGKQRQKAMELFTQMARTGKMPDRTTFNVLVELLDSEGQYESALYVYETAFRCSRPVPDWDPTRGDVIDLHGHSVAVAKAAVRSGLKTLLRRYLLSDKNPSVVKDFSFITGVGKHSKKPYTPIVRPATKNMLLEEFDPPLAAYFDCDNLGCLTVYKRDLMKWLAKQTEDDRRIPAPADSLGTLKFRGVEYLRQEFDKAVENRGVRKEGGDVGRRRSTAVDNSSPGGAARSFERSFPDENTAAAAAVVGVEVSADDGSDPGPDVHE